MLSLLASFTVAAPTSESTLDKRGEVDDWTLKFYTQNECNDKYVTSSETSNRTVKCENLDYFAQDILAAKGDYVTGNCGWEFQVYPELDCKGVDDAPSIPFAMCTAVGVKRDWTIKSYAIMPFFMGCK